MTQQVPLTNFTESKNIAIIDQKFLFWPILSLTLSSLRSRPDSLSFLRGGEEEEEEEDFSLFIPFSSPSPLTFENLASQRASFVV